MFKARKRKPSVQIGKFTKDQERHYHGFSRRPSDLLNITSPPTGQHINNEETING
ncbi:hypothetical protein [Denitratisoma oestradiolicum]|uniref:hypothetical protein n=1 Tax=Denitratisoma oestradiolicum TaxID=311182 RepID=UPI0014775D41|nr:hypothetical protein [Denitratisoma oestradiolicum]